MEKNLYEVSFDDDHGEPKRAIVMAASPEVAEEIIETEFQDCQIRNVVGSASRSPYVLVPRGRG